MITFGSAFTWASHNPLFLQTLPEPCTELPRKELASCPTQLCIAKAMALRGMGTLQQWLGRGFTGRSENSKPGSSKRGRSESRGAREDDDGTGNAPKRRNGGDAGDASMGGCCRGCRSPPLICSLNPASISLLSQRPAAPAPWRRRLRGSRASSRRQTRTTRAARPLRPTAWTPARPRASPP